MIVNRFDYRESSSGTIGVGAQLLTKSAFDPDEVALALKLMALRREVHGDGIVALDCGANIGVHTVEWARALHGWGEVVAIEAQERVFYALAGNLAINNCFNARALWAAVGAVSGTIGVPKPNYLQPGSFGSLELRKSQRTEFIGQPIDYGQQNLQSVQLIAIDHLMLPRVDFLKLDIEGMEEEAIKGAQSTLRSFRPILLVERIKSDQTSLRDLLISFGYRVYALGLNFLAIHPEDPCSARINVQTPEA